MLLYPVALPLSRQTLSHAALDHPPPPDRLPGASSTPGQQAMLVLA